MSENVLPYATPTPQPGRFASAAVGKLLLGSLLGTMLLVGSAVYGGIFFGAGGTVCGVIVVATIGSILLFIAKTRLVGLGVLLAIPVDFVAIYFAIALSMVPC